jgi:hypothetical protein
MGAIIAKQRNAARATGGGLATIAEKVAKAPRYTTTFRQDYSVCNVLGEGNFACVI